MKKLFILFVFIIASLSCFSIDLTRNFNLAIGTSFTSNYIWRGNRIAGEGIQPYINISYSSYSGTVELESFFSLNKGIEDISFYRESDLSLSYSSVENFFTLALFYYNYMGTFQKEPDNELELQMILYGSDAAPLQIEFSTQVFSDIPEGTANDTYIGLSYNFFLPHDWTITPEAAVSFSLKHGDNLQFRNLSLLINKSWEHDYFEVYINSLFAFNFNKTDEYPTFGYMTPENGFNWSLNLGIEF